MVGGETKTKVSCERGIALTVCLHSKDYAFGMDFCLPVLPVKQDICIDADRNLM